MTDPNVQPADPDVPANPDSSAGTSQAAAPEIAPNGVVPGDEPPEAAEADQRAVADSLRAQLAGLDELDDLPVAEHIERYEAAHNELHAALRGIHDPED